MKSSLANQQAIYQDVLLCFIPVEKETPLFFFMPSCIENPAFKNVVFFRWKIKTERGLTFLFDCAGRNLIPTDFVDKRKGLILCRRKKNFASLKILLSGKGTKAKINLVNGEEQ